MPNIVTNRVNAQLDAGGPSFSVSAEELSGLRAFELAVRALERGDVDAALVGATDLSDEPVHVGALAEIAGRPTTPGDAAVALVLKREDDARRDGDVVLALVDPSRDAAEIPLILGNAGGARSLADRLGEAHAASGLVAVAAALSALSTGVVSRAEVRMQGLLGPTMTVRLEGVGAVTAPAPRAPLRYLSLPAHPPAVSLPEGLSVERMEPAPKLVPVLSAAPLATAPSIAAIPATPVARPQFAHPGLAQVLVQAAEQHRAVGDSHRAFLAKQAEIHAQFLALRARTNEALLRGLAHGNVLPSASTRAPPRRSRTVRCIGARRAGRRAPARGDPGAHAARRRGGGDARPRAPAAGPRAAPRSTARPSRCTPVAASPPSSDRCSSSRTCTWCRCGCPWRRSSSPTA